tara:strand:- start:706 stop:1308 length:603 start_codon:yes stop_codon:yes gene_type:complete
MNYIQVKLLSSYPAPHLSLGKFHAWFSYHLPSTTSIVLTYFIRWIIRKENVYEQTVTLGTFVQLAYFLPPVTATFDQVHPVQEDDDPQVTTTSYPDEATAPVPTMFLTVKPVMGTPVVAVPYGKLVRLSMKTKEERKGKDQTYVEVTSIVVLLDQDTVFRDGRHGDAIVGNALDGSGCAGLGLDADSYLISLARSFYCNV